MVATLKEVRDYLEKHGSWPQRGAKATRDALAQAWRRILPQVHTFGAEIQESYSDVFAAWAGEERWQTELKGGLASFLEGKGVKELVAHCSCLKDEDVQRYIGSKTNDFRAACVDVLLGICDGEAALGDFRMTCEAEEEDGVDMDMLQRLRGDSTRMLRSKVEAFIAEHGRWPLSRGGTVEDERALALGMDQVRKRRFGAVKRMRKSKVLEYAAPLSEDEMSAWESLPCHGALFWYPHHIGVYEQVALELSQSGSLPVRGARSGSDALAQKVRRVRMKTLETGRARMRVAEQALWETSFPGIWERRQLKDVYIPDDALLLAEQRREFRRSPIAGAMLACELCSFECNVKEDFLLHLQKEHFAVPDGEVALDVSRCEEQYRKRMVFHERSAGLSVSNLRGKWSRWNVMFSSVSGF